MWNIVRERCENGPSWVWLSLTEFWLQTWSMTVWPSQIMPKLQSIKHATRTGSKAQKECRLNSRLVFSPRWAVAGHVCTADYTSAVGRWRNTSLEWKKVRPRDQEVGLLASNSLRRLWARAHTQRGGAAFLSGGLKRELGADVGFTCQNSAWVCVCVLVLYQWHVNNYPALLLTAFFCFNNPTNPVFYHIRNFLWYTSLFLTCMYHSKHDLYY